MVNVAPLAPGVMKVTFNQTYGGATNITNRLFFTFTGTLDVTHCNNIGSTFSTYWESYIAPLVNIHLTLQSVTVADLGSSSGAIAEVIQPHSGTVPIAGYLPAETNMVLHASISRRYRGGKPRWYQTGLTQANLADNQTFDPTFVGDFEAGLNNMIANAGGQATNGGSMQKNINLSLINGYTWIPYTTSSGKENYRKVPTYRDTPVQDVITDWVASVRIASQRKRGTNS